MAELGLVASIIALAGTGAKISLTLFAVADSIGSAARDARTIAREISGFSNALAAMSRCLERKTARSEQLREIALVLAEDCKTLLTDMTSLLGELASVQQAGVEGNARGTRVNSMGSSALGRVRSLPARVAWVFQKPKVVFMRSAVESFKSTLVLLVSSMDYAEAAEKHAPPAVQEPLRMHLKSSLKVQEDAIVELVDTKEQQYQMEELNKSTNSQILDDSSQFDEPLVEVDEPSKPGFSGKFSTASASSEITTIEEVTMSGKTNALIVLNNSCTAVSLGPSHIVHVRSQQMAYKFAMSVLKSSSGATWGWESTDQWSQSENFHNSATVDWVDQQEATRTGYPSKQKGADIRTPPVIAEESLSHDPFDFLEKDGASPAKFSVPASGVVQPETEVPRDRITQLEDMMKQVQDALNTSRLTPEPVSQRPPPYPASNSAPNSGSRPIRPRSEFYGTSDAPERSLSNSRSRQSWHPPEYMERPPISSLKSNASTLTAAASNMSSQDNELGQRFTRLENLLLEKMTDQNAAVLDQGFIKFKDAVGRKFSFPWENCRTWRGMKELIDQAFLHVQGIEKHVKDGHFDLLDSNGEIILPQLWERIVQPEMTISMHMWPMQDEPRPTHKAAPPRFGNVSGSITGNLLPSAPRPPTMPPMPPGLASLNNSMSNSSAMKGPAPHDVPPPPPMEQQPTQIPPPAPAPGMWLPPPEMLVPPPVPYSRLPKKTKKKKKVKGKKVRVWSEGSSDDENDGGKGKEKKGLFKRLSSWKKKDEDDGYDTDTSSRTFN